MDLFPLTYTIGTFMFTIDFWDFIILSTLTIHTFTYVGYGYAVRKELLTAKPKLVDIATLAAGGTMAVAWMASLVA